MLRTLFYRCHQVHADFTEYNLLWYRGKAYVNDVSQSVEHDHPNSLVFLRKDCENVIAFFRRHGVPAVPSLQALFDYVTDPLLPIAPDEARAAYELLLAPPAAANQAGAGELPPAPLPRALEDSSALTEAEAAEAAAAAVAAAEAEVQAAVFSQMYIPRTMEEVTLREAEHDIAAAAKGQGGTLAYTKLMGLNADLSVGTAAEHSGGEGSSDCLAICAALVGSAGLGGEAAASVALRRNGGEESAGEGEEVEQQVKEEEEEGEDDEEGDEDDNDGSRLARKKVFHRDEDPEAKRERKAAVKAAQREARLAKTPKHVKKQKSKAKR